jgi:hypothetical protein
MRSVPVPSLRVNHERVIGQIHAQAHNAVAKRFHLTLAPVGALFAEFEAKTAQEAQPTAIVTPKPPPLQCNGFVEELIAHFVAGPTTGAQGRTACQSMAGEQPGKQARHNHSDEIRR